MSFVNDIVETEKPPLGIVPKCLWEEQRYKELKQAILRYWEVDKSIPTEWIEEYNEFIVKK